MPIRYEDLVAMSELCSEVPVSEIQAAISSSDSYLNWIGAKLAGQSRDVRWVARLKELAIKPYEEGGPDVSTIAVWALARMPHEVVAAVSEELANEHCVQSRRAAADLIGEAKDKSGLNLLARLLDDEEMEVVKWSALSLAKVGEESVDVLKKKGLASGDIRVVGYCLDGLLKLGKEDLAKSVVVDRQGEFSEDLSTLINALERQNA